MSSKHMRAILFWGWNRWPNFLRYSLYSWLMSRWVRVLYNQGFSLYSCIFSWNECTCTLYVQLNFNYMRSIFLSSICRVTQVAGFRYLKPNLWFMQKSLVDVKNVTTRLAWGTVWSTTKKWNMKSALDPDFCFSTVSITTEFKTKGNVQNLYLKNGSKY